VTGFIWAGHRERQQEQEKEKEQGQAIGQATRISQISAHKTSVLEELGLVERQQISSQA
jgi:hypothetical protein